MRKGIFVGEKGEKLEVTKMKPRKTNQAAMRQSLDDG
jgi:hypothetical protein